MPDAFDAYVPRLLVRRDARGPARWNAEGTLMFADVSGFTRLTEKLSRAGKAGGEEIVRIISDVFTVLLTATADGGDVLKFSGDALLLFYDGDDHAHRACHAALSMQRVLRAVGGIDSSRGRVRLRMSVGVHTGRFAFFLCGADHLELYVLGPGATCTVAAEADARGGEVVVTDATAAAVPGVAVRGRRGDGHVLRSVPSLAPTAPPLAPPAGGATDAQLERHIAPGLRSRLDGLEHEHRRGTVSFAHFGGVDDLLAEEGADAAFARVQALTTTTMAALDEYGVLLTATDVAIGGGALMLTAGAPDAAGDDEARMLRVARRIVDGDHGLPVRIGVHAGALFTGPVGAPFRRTYSTMGAATNLAARVMRAAPWGGVLATTTVTDEVGPRFVTRPVPPLLVKGHEGEIHARLVDGTVDASIAADRSVPFTGRAAELAALVDAADAARAGRGMVVEIVGGAGVGTSRLVAELRAGADGLTWVQVACDRYERTTPYATSSLVLRRVLQIPDDASAADAGAALAHVVATAAPGLRPWLPLLASAVRAEVGPTPEATEVAAHYRPERVHQVVADLLGAPPADPGVVVIEDAEHCDDASAELIAAVVARMLPAHPWLVVVTRHDAGPAGLHQGRGYAAQAVRVGPLDDAASAELASRLAEHTPVPVHRMPQLIERAAGNPLFLAALVTAQADLDGGLPRSVEAIIATRIDRLDPDDRRALRHLAVLGDRFDGDLVDAALGPDGLARDQCDRWRRLAEFITTDGTTFAFRNALVREVAYEGLAFRRRRQLHARVADALRGTAAAATSQLPVHLLRAERWADAWNVTRRAADHARDAGASAVAGELYDMALHASRRQHIDDTDVFETALAAGDAWERAGEWQRALAAYDIAADAASTDDGRLTVTLRRARAHERAARYPQALRLYRRVITATGPSRGALSARAHAGYASARLGQGRAADAVAHAQRAVELADGVDAVALAEAYHLLDRAHTALGQHTAASRFRDAALPVYAALGDLAAQGTVLFDLGRDAQHSGRLEEALWLYGRSHEARARAGDVVQVAASANAIGEVLLVLGRRSEAQARFVDALRAWRGARAWRGVAEAKRNLGVVALRDGRHADAIAQLEEAATVAASVGADALVDEVQLPLARALLAANRYVEAWEAATRVLEQPPTEDSGHARGIRGEALLRTGGVARARIELAAALDVITDPDGASAVRRLLDEADAAAP